MINKKDLKKFLKEAKINTYASGGEEGEVRLKDSGKKFEYKKGNFYYRDIYYGFNPFIGEEIVCQGEKVVWGMNYCGKIVSKIILPKQIYQFLQEALRKIPKSKPYRGPNRLKKDNFEYLNKVKGTIEKFEGEETIFYKGRLVYKLIYHGGIIIEK